MDCRVQKAWSSEDWREGMRVKRKGRRGLMVSDHDDNDLEKKEEGEKRDCTAFYSSN